jgi:hypothetical protein
MTYTVTDLCRVNHDGTIYTEGQEIPGLTAKQAEPLLALGVVAEISPPAKPPAK